MKKKHSPKRQWHNYKTGEREYIETPTDFTNYIPQYPAAQWIYQHLLMMGKSPIDAAYETLSVCIGLPPTPPDSTPENAEGGQGVG